MMNRNILANIYKRLLDTYGSQSWWPAETPFEVMIGAILTQNTNWSNVEKAISSLKQACDMTPKGVLALAPDQLQTAVRPSGYYRQKAERLHIFCRFLIEHYDGDLTLMGRPSIQELRQQFLGLKGIGPETADSILLYACDRPVFVVDAYTGRLFSRLGLCEEGSKYHEVQGLFMDNLEPDVDMFNEYHALIVRHAKERCRKREPVCEECILAKICNFNLKSKI
jgi:endonuclease-3 related protein